MDLNSIPLSECAHDERILDGGPAERDCGDPYEPVCDTCGGNKYVYVHDGRSNQRQPCPDCILRGLA